MVHFLDDLGISRLLAGEDVNFLSLNQVKILRNSLLPHSLKKEYGQNPACNAVYGQYRYPGHGDDKIQDIARSQENGNYFQSP